MADKKDVKDVKSNPLAGGCPVPHDKRGGAAAVNPHGTGAAAASVTASTHAATATERATQRAEVPDTAERELKLPSMTGAHHNVKVERAAGEAGDFVPDSTIPAAGRGNSDDGKNWLNPSANQLFRALARKNKPIESDDAPAVAMVHEMVTNGTWAAIMEYEAMHSHKCRAPKLDRFQGMDGIYSAKAKLVRLMTGAVPFDRHDWYINRCGKEVKYIIDYYEIPEPNGQISYSVDARPAPTPSGIWDRMRMAWKKWRAGEQVW